MVARRRRKAVQRRGGGSPSCWLECMQTGDGEFTKGSDSDSNMFSNCTSPYAFVEVCWKLSNLLPRTSGGGDRLPPLPPVDHATCARPPLNYHAYQIRQKAEKRNLTYVRWLSLLSRHCTVYGTLGTPPSVPHFSLEESEPHCGSTNFKVVKFRTLSTYYELPPTDSICFLAHRTAEERLRSIRTYLMVHSRGGKGLYRKKSSEGGILNGPFTQSTVQLQTLFQSLL